jgi:hypothetical protein
VVASKKNDTYIFNLAETFTNMREAWLKLNLEKCIFGITRGKVLGCLVSTKGIKANLDKIRAITQMQPPHNRKEFKKLTNRIAVLNRFIAQLAKRSLPFFTVLRGFTRVDWGAEQQKAFEDLKHYLDHLPTLSSLEQGQPLILYVSTTHSAVSGALVVKKEIMRDNKNVKQQLSVYFMSDVLTESKKYYSEMEKICYADIMSARKLFHYFEAYTIKVLINQPLNDIFSNRDSFGRINEWMMECQSTW